MSIRKRSRFGLLALATIPLFVAFASVDTHARAPAPVYRENHTRTYRFKARITKNDGVTPR